MDGKTILYVMNIKPKRNGMKILNYLIKNLIILHIKDNSLEDQIKLDKLETNLNY
jgi:hypothetical protein